MFNPYYLPYAQWNNQMLSRKFPVKRLNIKGIPYMQTIQVSTNGTVQIYQLCPWRFKQLCNEGLMLLRISQAPTLAAGSVSLQTQSNPPTNSTGTALVDGLGADLSVTKITNGQHLLVYFNKTDGIFQVVNSLA